MPKIAVVQFAPVAPSPKHDSPAENLRRAHGYVHEAAEKGAEIVVFPEYFCSGIIADVPSSAHAHYTQKPHYEHAEHPTDTTDTQGHWLESFRQLAIRHSVDIVPGTIVERSGETNEDGTPALKNVAHYITKRGEIVGRYEKRNLWWPEKDYLAQGTEDHQVFDTDYGRVGLLVCWDLAWPEAFRALLLQNVDMVIAPTCWLATDATPQGLARDPNCEAKFLDVLIPARAWENECAVVFVNCGGQQDEGWIGGSGVAVPFQGWIGRAKGSQEQIIYVDLDLGILKDARDVYGIRRDLVTKLRVAGRLPEGVEP